MGTGTCGRQSPFGGLARLQAGRRSFYRKRVAKAGIQKQCMVTGISLVSSNEAMGSFRGQVPRRHEGLIIIADLALSRVHVVFSRTVCSPPRPDV